MPLYIYIYIYCWLLLKTYRVSPPKRLYIFAYKNLYGDLPIGLFMCYSRYGICPTETSRVSLQPHKCHVSKRGTRICAHSDTFVETAKARGKYGEKMERKSSRVVDDRVEERRPTHRRGSTRQVYVHPQAHRGTAKNRERSRNRRNERKEKRKDVSRCAAQQ